MTWKDFKEAVEKQGVKDQDELAYIDSDLWSIKCEIGTDKRWRIH